GLVDFFDQGRIIIVLKVFDGSFLDKSHDSKIMINVFMAALERLENNTYCHIDTKKPVNTGSLLHLLPITGIGFSTVFVHVNFFHTCCYPVPPYNVTTAAKPLPACFNGNFRPL
ncbi:MAG TPA: hypothetical protein PLQ32_14370, partial [Flavihumibacter sp.]|nr:hypothetical protein [Flavihumibacter sp.]